MSRNTYTITVILKAFFADYRAQAKIFISENIETVLDLEKKISRIFGIKDFHLLSNEKLLPSCEDIRLLDSGDIVCVLPNESQSNIFLLPEKFYSTNNETTEYKKKKRENLDDECPIKEKKCKKKRKETIYSDDEKLHDSSVHKLTKKLEEFSNEVKKKNRKDKSEANINNIPQPEQNKCQIFSSTPHEIKYNTNYETHVKKQTKNALVDGKTQDSVYVNKTGEGKYRLAKEPCTNINGKKQKNINHLSDENADSNSKIKLVSQYFSDHATEKSTSIKFVPAVDRDGNTNFEPNSTNKVEEFKNIKLKYSPNNSLKMIVDNSSSSSSSSSENETDEKNSNNLQPEKTKKKARINKNKSEISKIKTLNQSTDQIESNINTQNKAIESIDDSDKIQKKGCSLYILPVKKKNSKSWSTSPLLKITNHVKISRVPIAVSVIDSSKFVFNPSDVGAVPVPKIETECIANDISSLDVSKPLINTSQCDSTYLSPTRNISTEEFSLSENDKVEKKSNTFPKKITDFKVKAVEEFHQSSDKEHCMISTCIPKNTEKSEKMHPLDSDKVVDDKLENFDGKVTNKNIVLKNWRQSILDKLTDNTQNPLQNEKRTLSVANQILEKNEDELSINLSKQSLKSPEVMKSNANSYQVRKGNRLNDLGLSHYLKLLDKSDWDVTNSTSNKDAHEIESPSENKEIVIHEKEQGFVNNEMEVLENIDLSSMSSTGNDFITKRKRKRKHKKKVRVDTPVPIARKDFQLSKQLTLVKGTPKVHIRFQNDENDNPSAEDNAVYNEASVNLDKSNEKVKILQNVSLDLSMQNEGNIFHLESLPTETDKGGSNLSAVNLSHNVDEFKNGEKDFSIPTDDNVKTKLSSLNSSELHSENENVVLNQQLLSSSNSDSSSKNPKSGCQKIALDYTNQNLTSNGSDKHILNSSCNELTLNTKCQDEALEQAKVALLKAVGFLTPDTKIDQRIADSNECCEEFSIIDITEDSV